jgi:hypothetical protein
MHWMGWYSAMALNHLSGRCGNFLGSMVLSHWDCSKTSQTSTEYVPVYPHQSKGSRKNRVSPGHQKLAFDYDIRFNQVLEG